MFWKKLLKQCCVSRASLIRTLVLVNIILALYTIPALLRNRSKETNVNTINDPNNPLILNKRRTSGSEPSLSGTDSRQVPVEKTGTGIGEFFYLHQPKEGCFDDNPFLVLAVCSAVNHFDLRDAIRRTWASVIQKHRISTKIVFVLGAPSAEFAHLQPHVTRESALHGDVLQGDFKDSHVSLTTKTLSVIRWSLTSCPSVKFFMKVDDDVFINVANLISVLLDVATRDTDYSKPFMLGHVIRNARPISDRSSKWYTPTVMLRSDTYPDYLSGSAYVISGNALASIYSAALSLKPFWLEDVYITGMISRELNIPLVHEERFTFRKPEMFHPCLFRILVTAHQISVTEMHDIWRQLHSADLDCSGYPKRIGETHVARTS